LGVTRTFQCIAWLPVEVAASNQYLARADIAKGGVSRFVMGPRWREKLNGRAFIKDYLSW